MPSAAGQGEGSIRATAIPGTLALLVILAGTSGLGPALRASSVEYVLLADPAGWRLPDAEDANPILAARAGEPITVVVRWAQGIHNFAVYAADLPTREVVPGHPDAIIRSEPVTASRRAASLTFTILAPGTYAYVSEYRSSAMAGILAVDGPDRANRPPSVGPLRFAPASPIPGEAVRFEATASDPDGDTLAVRWDVGGASRPAARTSPGGGPLVGSHRFDDPGPHRVGVTVSDSRGGSASAEATVHVADPALLRVVTVPALPSMISVDGIERTEWGLSWMKIDPGDHTVSFSDVPGYGTPPPSSAPTGAGQTTEVVGRFAAWGFLRVTTLPALPATIYVDGLPRNDWGLWVALPPGTYGITFGPVAGYVPPAPMAVPVAAGELTVVNGEYRFDGVSPGPIAGTYGYLRVTTSPAVPTQISLDGIPRDGWGLNWLKLPPGTYDLRVSDVPGFGTPDPRPVTIRAGATEVVEMPFAVHGSLRVTSDPAAASTIFVDGIPRDDWGVWRSIPPGTYEISFGPVAGFVPPMPTTVTVEPGQTSHVRGMFAQALATELNWPTALAVAPDGRVFFAERLTGAIRVLQDRRVLPDPFAVLPGTATGGEQGLLGLALHPDFPEAPWLYAYQTYVGSTAVYNRIVRLRADGDVAGPPQPIFAPLPASTLHNGGVIAFGPDGTLYALVGDAQDEDAAQDLNALNGKVLRMTAEGVAPPDNPFVGRPNANAYVYTYGHRNMFGIAFHPATGRAYVTENGPEDSDEVNLLEPGGNYGWPIVRGIAGRPQYVDPLVEYTPTIAPTNAIVYEGVSFPEFNGDLLFGDWNTGSVRRLHLAPPAYETVSAESIVLVAPLSILDVELQPDGSIWFTTHDAIYRWGGPPWPAPP